MTTLLLALAAVLLATAICSGIEAALFSVNPIKVRHAVSRGSRSAKTLLYIRENMERPIATLVVFINVTTIVGSMWLGYLSSLHLVGYMQSVFPFILTLLVIIFSEIIPKTLGERYSFAIAMTVARPLHSLCLLMTPILVLLEKVTAPFAKGGRQLTTNEAEIKLMASIGHKEGVIERNELTMLQNVFKLNDLKASDIMTPRIAVSYLQANRTLLDAKRDIIQSPHSRLILVDGALDEVLGIVYKVQCLEALADGYGQKRLRDFKRRVAYVPESIRADRLLEHFRHSHRHLAVVGDEFGGLRGVVSLEDVVEVLTGQIVDETDKVTDLRKEARKIRRRRQRQKSS